MVKVYISDSCPVCESMKSQLDDLAKQTGEVEVVSIDTEAGFDEFAKEVLDKSPDGEAGVPTAYAEGEKCKILRGADRVAIRCGQKLIGATPEEVEEE